MKTNLKTHLDTLVALDRQRIIWLKISGFISVAIIAIIIGWDSIHRNHLSFFIASIGLTVSVVWWYWTMIIVRKLINARITENKMLTQLAEDFEELKKAIKGFEKNH